MRKRFPRKAKKWVKKHNATYKHITVELTEVHGKRFWYSVTYGPPFKVNSEFEYLH